MFRIDRIRAAEATGESFTPKADPPPPVVRYTPSEEDARAVIRLGSRARWVVESYPVEVLEENASTTTVRFSASDPKVAARLLLRLGEDADLVDGKEVATALDALREEILTRYDYEE